MVFSLFQVGFAEGGGPGGLVQFLPFILIFGIFYFLLIAPMRKRQKAHQKMLEALKSGDRVLTNGGIYGEVSHIDGNVVHLRVTEQIKLRVAKSAIATLEGTEE